MGWGDKLNQMTQSAVSKSRELAEITRLNMENNGHEQKIRELAVQIGMYVESQKLLGDDEQVAGWTAQMAQLREAINQNRAAVQSLKNINICANCGAEVARSSKFCDKCGSPIERIQVKPPAQAAAPAPVCPACGEQLDPGARFCTSCGAKLSD